MALWKFNTLAVFDDVSNPFGGMTITEMDQVKRLFLEMNPTWLCALLLLSGFYCLFSFLAFQNGNPPPHSILSEHTSNLSFFFLKDILFWTNKQSKHDVSLFGMKLRLMADAILLLNVMDDRRATTAGPSGLLLLTHSISAAVQMWKMNKLLPKSQQWLPTTWVQQLWCPEGGKIPISSTSTETYKADNGDPDNGSSDRRSGLSQRNTTTIKSSLGLVLIGCICLWHRKSAGWVSLLLDQFAQMVYLFDFLLLLPQAIRNYQLKKVSACN